LLLLARALKVHRHGCFLGILEYKRWQNTSHHIIDGIVH
jgi:hypothetical protein